MAYKITDEMIRNYNYNYDSLSENKIIKINEYYNQQKIEYEKSKYMLDVLLKEKLSIIKSNVFYTLEYMDYKKAQKWLSMKDNCDKRKKYEEKDAYNTIISRLSSVFFNHKEIEIKEILSCGYETYGVSYRVDFNGIIFDIQIPIINNLTTKNMEYTNDGKIHVTYQKSTHFYEFICNDYNEEIIAKKIKEFLKTNNIDIDND